MSTSDVRTASPSPLTPNGFIADEAALKRAFDGEYANCLTSAKAQLGDAGTLAPHVVETAFICVWTQRETITTPEQLRTVLAEEVRHGAARALSRRHSGARLGSVGAGGGASVKAAAHAVAADHESPEHVWALIQKSIHAASHSAEAHAAAAEIGRHDAAVHLKDMSKRPGWVIPVAIGVVALLVSIGGVLYVDRLGEDDAVLATVASQSIQPIASNAGQIGNVRLGDGSQMRIGPETKIYIPDGFATKNRAIKVEGTATFDVAKGQTMPFRVVARRTHFIATGTKFTISTFAADSSPAVLVEDGSVTIKTKSATATVNANQAMVVDASGIRPATDDERAERFGWTTGQITLRNKQLRQAVDALTRWFNYDVKVPDTPLLDRPATLDVPLDSSKLAISQVEKSANVKFTYEGDTKVFRDAGAANAAKGTKAAPPAKKK